MSVEITERPRFVPAAGKRPRQRWLRWVTQFSLRTLLVGTTLAAVACWWWLRPESGTEEFAGGKLKLWRQTRTRQVDTVSVPSPGGISGAPGPNAVIGSELAVIVMDGAWRLSDENGDLLVSGRYVQDVPQGKWTTWHINGRKAAEGRVNQGVRTGVWRTWHENGKLASEVTYRDRLIPGEMVGRRARRQQHWYPLNAEPPSLGPVGPGAPLFQVGGGFDAGSWRGSGDFYANMHPRSWTQPGYQSQRHGPVRVWYASGQLRFEGQYADDLRDGLWTYYDEQGTVVERGRYANDLREGEWQAMTSGGAATVRYFSGRTAAEQEAIMTSIRDGLASNVLRVQLASFDRAEQFGPAGAALLIEAFDARRSDNWKLLALRRLTRMKAVTPRLLPAIEPLVEHPEPRLANLAKLAVYQADPERRHALFSVLAGGQAEFDHFEERLELLELMAECDAERRPLVLLKIIELLAHEQPMEFGPILRADPQEATSLLVQAYSSSDADVRLYALGALEQVIERVPPETEPDADRKQYWALPEAVKGVIARAKAENDPDIPAQAKEIGVFNPPPAGRAGAVGGGFGGMGGGGGFF